MQEMRIRVTLLEPMLGTTPGNKDIFGEFIASKHPDGVGTEEVQAVEDRDLDEEMTKETTFLPKDAEGYYLWDYQFRGFLKAALRAVYFSGVYTQEAMKKLDIYKSRIKRVVDTKVFVTPRRIRLDMPSETGFVERPLRAETMKGERSCLARSEAAPAGTTFELTVSVMAKGEIWPELIEACLEYGKLNGLLQWRNAGYGRFEYEIIE